ncbi:MAG: RNA 2',3'-cyclic phosphodiesterase [Betaproteobacteria bacterium]|nr:RNA 2',3'-cyclic phosphodiesterase [Betaproteobacteria bacterium]
MTRRIFFALVPPPGVLDAIEAVVNKIHPEMSGRVMQRATLHMTLCFLGDRTESELQTAYAVGEQLAARQFVVQLDWVERWAKNGILWMGCSQTSQTLNALALQIYNNLARAGIAGLSPGFMPHVTLLRKTEKSFTGQAVTPISWAVFEFCLLESSRTSLGAEYRCLRTWPLNV